MTLWDNSLAYYKARPLPFETWDAIPTGSNFEEEAAELLVELRRPELDHDAIRKEIGDVANTLSWIAHCFDTSVEDCQVMIIEKDRGRGLGNPNRYRVD
jgi:NTP pyrophosphatase (non-canonical NTP hydrolase)